MTRIRLRRSVLAAMSVALVLGGCTTAPVSPTPTASPTSPLFGQPAPIDPCSLLREAEILTVLQSTEVTTHAEESAGGASRTCFYDTVSARTFVRVTVLKEPRTVEQFDAQREQFSTARVVGDLGVPVYVVAFGPLATGYALKDGVEFFVDVARDGTTGGDMIDPAIALVERALSRA